MSIIHLDSVSQLTGILSKSKDKISVIDFHATWCGPCHAIAPTFESLAKQYGAKMNFFKCDVDAAKDVASMYQVSAMPTFIFLQGSTKVGQIRGADKRALEEQVKKLAAGSGGSSSAFSGQGNTLGGNKVGPDPVKVMKDKANEGIASVTNADPQLRVFLGIVAAYLVFWYVTS